MLVMFLLLLGLVVFGLVNLFRGFSRGVSRAVAIGGATLFSLYIIVDFNRLIYMEDLNINDWNTAFYMSYTIYLDIIKDRMYVSKNDSQARKSAQIAMEKILNILVRVVSPILSFTSEEIWQSSEIFTSQHKSVFLASYESEIFINQKISDQKWEHIFAIKDSVNLAIEQARSEDRVKGSLDCKITLELSTELFNLLKIFDKELQLSHVF